MKGRFEIIGNAGIPDEDMKGWVESLAGSELSEEEIEAMLSDLNPAYAEIKGEPRVEAELQKIDSATAARRGYGLTPEEKEYFRKAIKSRTKKD